MKCIGEYCILGSVGRGGGGRFEGQSEAWGGLYWSLDRTSEASGRVAV